MSFDPAQLRKWFEDIGEQRAPIATAMLQRAIRRCDFAPLTSALAEAFALPIHSADDLSAGSEFFTRIGGEPGLSALEARVARTRDLIRLGYDVAAAARDMASFTRTCWADFADAVIAGVLTASVTAPPPPPPAPPPAEPAGPIDLSHGVVVEDTGRPEPPPRKRQPRPAGEDLSQVVDGEEDSPPVAPDDPAPVPAEAPLKSATTGKALLFGAPGVGEENV